MQLAAKINSYGTSGWVDDHNVRFLPRSQLKDVILIATTTWFIGHGFGLSDVLSRHEWK